MADFQRLQSELETSHRQIAALTDTVAKLKAKPSNVRNVSEIVDGAPTMAAGDWREPYQGIRAWIQPFSWTDPAKPETFTVHQGEDAVLALLALPRDNDVGGRPGESEGAANRNGGRLAVHWNASEDGMSYQGRPSYLDPRELAAVFISAADTWDTKEQGFLDFSDVSG